MTGADRCGEGIAAGALNKLDGFLWIRQRGMALIDLDIFLDPSELSEFCFDADPLCVGTIDHAAPSQRATLPTSTSPAFENSPPA